MEVKNNIDEKLQILTSKTLDFHDRMNEKINEQGFIICSNHDGYCVVAAAAADKSNEREKMVAIRNSLKQLHDVITSLQKVRSTHERQRDDALARVEESRKVLIERVKRCRCRCSEKEREKVDVLEEVIEFSMNLKWEILDEKIEENNGFYSFLVRTTRFGLEFGVIFATLYYTYTYSSVKLQSKSRQQNRRDSRILLPADSDVVHLHVLCGRG